MTFILVLLVPLLVSGAVFLILHATISAKEFALQLVLGVVVAALGWQLAKWGALQDTEHLNGRITQKVADTQKCCHCHDECTARDKKGNCTSSRERCSHFRDYYWELKTSAGDVTVEDCSGTDSPPNDWTYATIGEPATIQHRYTNYLLADPDSLMVHAEMERFAQHVPPYPAVHSTYRVNHVIGDLAADGPLQQAMREMNADLGALNQVDITLLLTSQQDPTYAQAIEAKWLYGPKNSLTIVAGLQGRVVKWVRVITFSKVELLKVRLRDKLQGIAIDDPHFIATIRQEISGGFKRTSMADVSYLAETASPQGLNLLLLVFGELVASVALAWWAHAKDIFGDERFRSLRHSFKKF